MHFLQIYEGDYVKEIEEGIYVCPQCKTVDVVNEVENLDMPGVKICLECDTQMIVSTNPFDDIEESPHRVDGIEAVRFCLDQIRKYGIADKFEWHTKINEKLSFFEVVNTLVAISKDVAALEPGE